MKEKKYTKKATARIYKEVIKYDKGASKNTSLDQAYVILMTAWDMEGGIDTRAGHTKFTIYRDNESVRVMEWPDVFKDGDWDWSVIYKDVLEVIIKDKLFKRPKKSKKAAAEPVITQELPAPQTIERDLVGDIERLNRLKNSTSVKISSYKKKGKDIKDLVEKYNEVSKQLKELKEQLKKK